VRSFAGQFAAGYSKSTSAGGVLASPRSFQGGALSLDGGGFARSSAIAISELVRSARAHQIDSAGSFLPGGLGGGC